MEGILFYQEGEVRFHGDYFTVNWCGFNHWVEAVNSIYEPKFCIKPLAKRIRRNAQ
jgi:hypothetical protein